MRFFLRMAVLVGVVSALHGCSYATSLLFLNATPGRIHVRVTETGESARSDTGHLEPSERWRSRTPENGQGWRVSIGDGDCEQVYVVPSSSTFAQYLERYSADAPLDSSAIVLVVETSGELSVRYSVAGEPQSGGPILTLPVISRTCE
jgi:hypothetical protein